MRSLAFLLAMTACADLAAPPVEPPASPPAPGLWFVASCTRPAIWFLTRDTEAGPAPQVTHLFGQTDSLRLEPTGARTLVQWYELGDDGRPAQSGWAYTDSVGVGRIPATCLPAES